MSWSKYEFALFYFHHEFNHIKKEDPKDSIHSSAGKKVEFVVCASIRD